MIELRPFSPSDLLMIAVDNRTEQPRTEADLVAWAKAHAMHGPAFTVLLDGRIVAAGGFHIFWDGLAEGWASVSREATPMVAHAMRRQLDRLLKDYHIRRFQAISDFGWETGKRFMVFMGLHPEAVLRRMGRNGEDMLLASRFS